MDEDFAALRRIKVVGTIQCFFLPLHLRTACFVTDEFAMQEVMARFSAKVDKIKGHNTSLQKKIHHLVGKYGVLKAESEANARSTRSCKIQYSDVLVECDKLKKKVEELRAQPPMRVVSVIAIVSVIDSERNWSCMPNSLNLMRQCT